MVYTFKINDQQPASFVDWQSQRLKGKHLSYQSIWSGVGPNTNALQLASMLLFTTSISADT
jgi:hypothetical protein